MKTWLLSRWDALRGTFWFVPLLMVAGAVRPLAAHAHPGQGGGRARGRPHPRLDVHPRAGGVAGAPRDRRRVDDHHRQRLLLDHDRRPAAGVLAVRPAAAAQLHARPRQPGRPRHVHRHVHLLPARPADGQRDRGRPVRAPPVGHRRAASWPSPGSACSSTSSTTPPSRSRPRTSSPASAATCTHALDRLFPARPRRGAAGAGAGRAALPDGFAARGRPGPGGASDYLQAVDVDRVMRLAVEHDLVLEARSAGRGSSSPGATRSPRAWPAERADRRGRRRAPRGVLPRLPADPVPGRRVRHRPARRDRACGRCRRASTTRSPP